MTFDYKQYIPCLRWKMGEYQAVMRLSDDTKEKITPLIEIPQIGWDFEEGKEKKSIDDHLAPFPKRIHDKWGEAYCFIDIKHISSNKRMNDGSHPVNFILNSLNELNCSAVPVTGFEKDKEYQKEIKKMIIGKKTSGICLRFTIDQVARTTFNQDLDSLLSLLNIKPYYCNLVLDLVSPNFIPLEGFLLVIQQIIKSLPYLNSWRSFSIIGTSFPETMGGIPVGIKILPRYEWQLYKKLIELLSTAELRLPTYGDYGILNPSARDDLDWRVISTSANIRYTIDDNWCIVRGRSDRDRKLVLEMYFELSRNLVNSNYYYGPELSWGDAYIKDCADNKKGHGTHTTWRTVGTNHHMKKVVQEISNFYESLDHT